MSPMARQLYERWARWARPRRSVIFNYHGVGATTVHLDPGFLQVHPDDFRAQIELLVGAGFDFVTVAEFAERCNGQAPPPGLVALSFDDGMEDNHANVLPILREHGLRATVYVTTGLIGQPNPWLATESGARMMTLAELRELVDGGWEIGAHTVTHPHLSQLDHESCFREASESRLELERLLGVSVKTFAYPFCVYTSDASAAVREAGFAAAVTCGSTVGSWDPYELPRTIVSRLDSMTTFVLKLSGLHERIFVSPPGRLLRAATRSDRYRRRERLESRRSEHGG